MHNGERNEIADMYQFMTKQGLMINRIEVWHDVFHVWINRTDSQKFYDLLTFLYPNIEIAAQAYDSGRDVFYILKL